MTIAGVSIAVYPGKDNGAEVLANKDHLIIIYVLFTLCSLQKCQNGVYYYLWLVKANRVSLTALIFADWLGLANPMSAFISLHTL